MIYNRQLESHVENEEKITEEGVTKYLFPKCQQIGTRLFKEEIMNHTDFFLSGRIQVQVLQETAEKQRHEPFAIQTRGTVHLTVSYV